MPIRSLVASAAIVLSTLLGSCVSDYPTDNVVWLDQGESEHTLVMYMFADNNLSSYMMSNIYNAEKGLMDCMPSSRVVVYLDRADSTALYELSYLPYGSEEHIRHWKQLKCYSKQDSSDPEVMRQVMADVREFAPSRSYGLVMSGHGTGWFPKPSSGTQYHDQRVASQLGSVDGEYPFGHLGDGAMTRMMGYDSCSPENSLTSDEMIEGVQDMHFDYILFDACFMGSVEFLYDLRGVTDYVISSPVEVMNAGMPYTDIIPLLFAAGRDLTEVASTIVDVYKNTGFSTKKSVAISVVDCSKLEALADVLAYIYKCAQQGSGMECVELLADKVDKSKLQPLDRVVPTAFYDLEDFGLELCGGDEELERRWMSALSETILYSGHTEQIWSAKSGYDYWWIEYIVGDSLDLCGLNTYMPIKSAPVTASHYFKTDWARKIYGL